MTGLHELGAGGQIVGWRPPIDSREEDKSASPLPLMKSTEAETSSSHSLVKSSEADDPSSSQASVILKPDHTGDVFLLVQGTASVANSVLL